MRRLTNEEYEEKGYFEEPKEWLDNPPTDEEYWEEVQNQNDDMWNDYGDMMYEQMKDERFENE